MDQDSVNEITENESLDIVKNYLKQLNNSGNENILNNIQSFCSTSETNTCETNNNSTIQTIIDEQTTTINEIDKLKEKIELQNTLEKKLNDAIQKEKELLKITQEKLNCEVLLLNTVKQRLYEQSKINNSVKTENKTTNDFYDIMNTNYESSKLESETETKPQPKITRMSNIALTYFKR